MNGKIHYHQVKLLIFAQIYNPNNPHILSVCRNCAVIGLQRVGVAILHLQFANIYLQLRVATLLVTECFVGFYGIIPKENVERKTNQIGRPVSIILLGQDSVSVYLSKTYVTRLNIGVLFTITLFFQISCYCSTCLFR